MKVTFSAREITVLSSALYTARDEFLKHAATAKGCNHLRVEEQFLAQARDCSDMMEKLEDVQHLAVVL